jgi:hypothetical protein
MPALVAVRHDPHLRAFYGTLLARHKAKLQALIAVARKMLHAIFGMFRRHPDYGWLTLAAKNQTPWSTCRSLKERFSCTSPQKKNLTGRENLRTEREWMGTRHLALTGH